MVDWQPELYRRFEAERTRPAAELLARIRHHVVYRAVDLGCGPGNSTQLLHQAWPQAAILGVDHSVAMIAEAERRLPQLSFYQADFTDWQAEEAVDLIFANAALQWVGHHERLLPHLIDQLADQGILAIQMPDNLDQAYHRLMRETALLPQWRHKMSALRNRDVLPDTAAYYDMLAGADCSVDIWRTTYYHVMPDVESIAAWLESTGLRPFLNLLDENERQAFIDDYIAALRREYPQQADGNILLPYPRLFLVAQKR